MATKAPGNWKKWRAARDRALATKTECCPPPPGAREFLEYLIASSAASEEASAFNRRVRGLIPAVEVPYREVHAYVERALETGTLDHGIAVRFHEQLAFMAQLLEGISDVGVRNLAWTTVAEAARAAYAASHMSPLVIDNDGAFQTVPPLFASAMAYVYGTLAWRGLKIDVTPAGKGTRSVFHVAAEHPAVAGRRRRKIRRAAWGDEIPHSDARDVADRLLVWLAEDVARFAERKAAVPRVKAVPCSADFSCRTRRRAVVEAMARFDEIAKEHDARMPEFLAKRQAAFDRQLAIHHEDIDRRLAEMMLAPVPAATAAAARAAAARERDEVEHEIRGLYAKAQRAAFAVELATRAVPVVTLGGRRGRGAALCAECAESEKEVRDEMRTRRGFRDPLDPDGPRVSEKIYRLHLETKKRMDESERIESEDAAGLVARDQRRRRR